MGDSKLRGRLALAGIGIAIGVIGVLVFNASLEATATEEFCISCHEMEANPYASIRKTSHFSNVSGVRPTCPDCHVPQEFLPKIMHKIKASREVWGTLTGIIDTPEKYRAHAPTMKQREIERLRANDSRECRNCHDTGQWLTALQSSKAQKYHQAIHLNRKTCIDCHAGIAHPANTEGLEK